MLLATVWLGVFACRCAAQTGPDGPVPLPTTENPYVLHVYTDLLQIPALVLDWRGNPSTHLGLQDFRLQIDSGPMFTPTAVHPEGNDPLALALVLDASGAVDDLISALQKSPAHGFPRGLLPHDHIGVYAFDCQPLRTRIVPADVAIANDGVDRILASPMLHKLDAPHKTCRSSKRVWDAVTVAAKDLAEEPGRRAILLITDGDDEGSKVRLEDLIRFAQNKSISVFVLREPSLSANSMRTPRGLGDPVLAMDLPLYLAANTGGIVISTLGSHVAAELDAVITLLRSRYILQFPRPGEAGGSHHLDVKVSEHGATVRTAGITYPSRDAELMNDPNTVPMDSSKLPVIGKGKR